MGRITGRLLFYLFFLFCAVPAFALSPIPGSSDSQATIEIQAQDRVEREALDLPKDPSPDRLRGMEFVHSPQYTGSDETRVRCDEVGSGPQENTVIWQKSVQLTLQWLSTESALPQDPALDRGFGTYASQSFTGREWDEETGLYFYRARYMDPNVGRFTQEDPVGVDSLVGQSPYGYVGNNPLAWIDPFGDIRQGTVAGDWTMTPKNEPVPPMFWVLYPSVASMGGGAYVFDVALRGNPDYQPLPYLERVVIKDLALYNIRTGQKAEMGPCPKFEMSIYSLNRIKGLAGVAPLFLNISPTDFYRFTYTVETQRISLFGGWKTFKTATFSAVLPP